MHLLYPLVGPSISMLSKKGSVTKVIPHIAVQCRPPDSQVWLFQGPYIILAGCQYERSDQHLYTKLVICATHAHGDELEIN